jgi:hypothetical protein
VKSAKVNNGFALVSVVIVIVLVIIGFYAYSAFSTSQKTRRIDERVSALNFNGTLTKKQCGGGGVDTSEWCSYVVDTTQNTVVNDLKAAGFTQTNQGGSTVILRGGNPEMTISVKANGSTTLLDAKILKGGRTI